MRDIDIRVALEADLRRDHPDAAANRIWHEMPLCLGASRVDVCLINGDLTGFEIKSPRDNLVRLPSQVEIYGQVLDYAVLVGSTRFVDRARNLVPDWWGLRAAIPRADDVVGLSWLRKPRRNPEPSAESIAQLLWRNEALEELRLRGQHHGLSRATRWELWDRLVEALTLTELQSAVRQRLKARPGL
jgi:hypothetical protein